MPLGKRSLGRMVLSIGESWVRSFFRTQVVVPHHAIGCRGDEKTHRYCLASNSRNVPGRDPEVGSHGEEPQVEPMRR